MQSKSGSNFEWKFDILNMRVLHFEKLVPLHKEQSGKKEEKTTEKENHSAFLQKEEAVQESIEMPEKNRYFSRFCSLGYYDQMSYVKAKDVDAILDYKHCFLTKYPYKKSEQRIMTDQMFTLLTGWEKEQQDQQQEKSNQLPQINEEDPFEIEDKEQKSRQPFLGIILVTVGKGSGEEEENNIGSQPCDFKPVYKTLLKEYKPAFGINDLNFCYKVFYTPNCADLCIVMRTDTLQDIYNVKQQISDRKLDQIRGAVCHTTSYTLFELPDNEWYQSVEKNELLEKNQEIFLELRIICSQQIIKAIKESLPASCSLYGITGSGRYSLELDFKTFAELYPFIWQIKSGDETMNQITAFSDLQELFKKNVSQIQCTYMRVKYNAYQSKSNSLSGEEPSDSKEDGIFLEIQRHFK